MPARVVLGVGAGISAYKAGELLRLLTEAGHRVKVVPTKDALRFVGEATWAGLSGEPVLTDVWTGIAEAPHVKLGQEADLIAVVTRKRGEKEKIDKSKGIIENRG